MIQRIRAGAVAFVAALALLTGISQIRAASGPELDAEARVTLDRLFRQVPGTHGLAQRATGILIFPTIVKAGIGIGGEYGEGVLHVGGRAVGCFNNISASVGFQLGAQARSVVIMFMTPEALAGFRSVDGWKVGVDGSVAIIAIGAGGSIDTTKVVAPVVGFILDQKGLMYNLTLEGSKISRIGC